MAMKRKMTEHRLKLAFAQGMMLAQHRERMRREHQGLVYHPSRYEGLRSFLHHRWVFAPGYCRLPESRE